MANRTMTLNGVTLYPSSITTNPETIGSERRMADGTLRRVRLAVKRTWTLTWRAPTEAIRQSVQSLAGATGAITLVNEYGISATVLPAMQPLSDTITYSDAYTDAVQTFEGLTLTLVEV